MSASLSDMSIDHDTCLSTSFGIRAKASIKNFCPFMLAYYINRMALSSPPKAWMESSIFFTVLADGLRRPVA